MADTALSIARSVVGSVIGKAATAAAEEMSLLMGVQKEIWFMKDELKTMQAFLIAAEAMKKKKPLLKVWGEQVRSLSYDIEDCLDEFMVHVESQSLSQQLLKLKDRHRIAVQIRNLKSRVEEVSCRNTRYNLIEMEDNIIHEAHYSSMEDIRNHSAGNINEAELVGFDTPKRELLHMINIGDTGSHARVICVVGMGGLGKTTLVKKIYESKEDISRKFSCFAWITVSQSFSKIELLKDMIQKLLGLSSLQTCMKELEGQRMKVEDLAGYLTHELQDMRYFLVLDDLWDISDWNWIRNVSLPTRNNKGSQIIVTTRNGDLAKMCASDSALIYNLKPLNEVDATKLLLMKMKKTVEDMEKEDKLKNIVKRLVKKCGYLPLAILTIGALFATKHESKWEHLYMQLPSELENNLRLEAIRMMVTLSYNHFPSHLKPCFLYLSIFPEDFEITRKRLVDRWIAEGLVRAQVGMTLEDVGKHYFDELINRSMIQPYKVNLEGTVKSCRVHDIIRDIIVSLSREEGFVCTSGDYVPGRSEDNFRHVAYHVGSNFTMGMDWGRVRSLTIFDERSVEHSPSLCSPQLRMLRVLDLETVDIVITQKDISNIGFLCHLKYVHFPQFITHEIYELPGSIKKLKGLQVLDIGRTCISTLPTEICELQSLRSLRLYCAGYYRHFKPHRPMEFLFNSLLLPMKFTPLVDSKDRNRMIAELHMGYSTCWSSAEGVKVPRGIGKLKELQKLEIISIKRTSSKAIEEMGELGKLRKLHVETVGVKRKKCMILGKAIEKLSSLRSLIIDAGKDGTLEWIDSVSAPPLMRNLCLEGHIGDKVDWFMNLMQLRKLDLRYCVLEEGKAVEILGELPNLMQLRFIVDAYEGNELVFKQCMFPKLKRLSIYKLSQLSEIRFEQDASPKIESIEISDCRLELGINGIKHLPNLKEIYLNLGCKVARLDMLQDEVNEHPNHPVLLHPELGDPVGSDGYFDAVESMSDHDGEDLEGTVPTASDS